MLTKKATPKMIENWKKVWNEYKGKLKPNRKTGQELLDFLHSRYALTELYDKNALNIVIDNVLNNEPYKEKLPFGRNPLPCVFSLNHAGLSKVFYENHDEGFCGIDILVRVGLMTGFYCVEGSSFLFDELCAYQGLDEKDIENFYCVTQYISCLKRFGLLWKVLS